MASRIIQKLGRFAVRYTCACGCGEETHPPIPFCNERWAEIPVTVQARFMKLTSFTPEWNALVSRARKVINGAEIW